MKFFVLCIVLSLIGCNSQTSSSRTDLISADAKSVLTKSPVSFMSWNGEWQGTDIDTALAFLPDGRVQITHYGSGIHSVSGTYKTNGDKIMIDAPWEDLIEMPGCSDFPTLNLKRDSELYYLFPTTETKSLKYSANSGWPFKQTKVKNVKQPSTNARQ